MAQNARSHRKLKIAGIIALVFVVALLGFAGNWLAYLPQYFTSAMFDGLRHPTLFIKRWLLLRYHQFF